MYSKHIRHLNTQLGSYHHPGVPTLHLKQVDLMVSREYVQPLQLHLPGIGRAVKDTRIKSDLRVPNLLYPVRVSFKRYSTHHVMLFFAPNVPVGCGINVGFGLS